MCVCAPWRQAPCCLIHIHLLCCAVALPLVIPSICIVLFPLSLSLPLLVDHRVQANWHIRCFITFRLVLANWPLFCGYFVCVCKFLFLFMCLCVCVCLSCSGFVVFSVTDAVWAKKKGIQIFLDQKIEFTKLVTRCRKKREAGRGRGKERVRKGDKEGGTLHHLTINNKIK